MADDTPHRNTDERTKLRDRPPEIEKGAAERARRKAVRQQMTPDAEPDDTIEGEGTPGLTVGGGGHA
jgi:hypothetical protein